MAYTTLNKMVTVFYILYLLLPCLHCIEHVRLSLVIKYYLTWLVIVVCCTSAAARGATTSSDQWCESDFEEVAGPSARHAVPHLTGGTNGRRTRSTGSGWGPHVENVRYV